MARYCVICGHELVTENNVMVSDVIGEELSDNDDAMITYAHCPMCGCTYEMQDASNTELKFDEDYVGSFKIWNETQDENNEMVI